MVIRAFLASLTIVVFAIILLVMNVSFDKFVIIPLSVISLVLCLISIEKEGRKKLAIAGIALSLVAVFLGVLSVILRNEFL